MMPEGEVCPDKARIGRNWVAKATRRPETRFFERKSVHGSKMGPVPIPSGPNLEAIRGMSDKKSQLARGGGAE